MRAIDGPRPSTAPFAPFLASTGRVSLLQAVALAAPLAVDLATRGPALLPLFVTALAMALFWENLFAFLRHADMSLHGLTTAMLVTLFLPLNMEAWQLAVALSLGVVLGELVFGGRGFGFVNPAAATLALLVFSFPQLSLHAIGTSVALASMVGGLILLLAGLISWRVLAATMAMASAILALAGDLAAFETMAILVSAGLVFLIADTFSAACTNPGRWIYGALAGFLIAVFAGFSTHDLTSESIVFAALLASVFAPLIDHLVVLANAAMRQRHHAQHAKKRLSRATDAENAHG